jgi:putative toxin-antitoxin system antitoxin component (TIGR02293 family)
MTATEILGLGMRLPEREPLKVRKTLEAGLPASSLARFKSAARLADPDMASLLGIGERTLSRIKAARARRLPPELSDRLYAVASIYALAERVFGSRDLALGWMEEPQLAFGGEPPRALLSSEIGREQTRALLHRIEHGLLA